MSEIISISDDVYNVLTKLKGKDSYSFIIRKLLSEKDVSNKEEVLSFFGKDNIDGKKIKELSEGWKNWSEKYA